MRGCACIACSHVVSLFFIASFRCHPGGRRTLNEEPRAVRRPWGPATDASAAVQCGSVATVGTRWPRFAGLIVLISVNRLRPVAVNPARHLWLPSTRWGGSVNTCYVPVAVMCRASGHAGASKGAGGCRPLCGAGAAGPGALPIRHVGWGRGSAPCVLGWCASLRRGGGTSTPKGTCEHADVSAADKW